MSLLASLRPTLLHQTTRRSFATSPAARLSRITLVGRLADSPELQATSTGQDIVRYALGTQSGPKDNRLTSWWRIASFMPEGAARDALLRLGKGSLIYLDGECIMNKFETKEGTPVTALNITQRAFEVLDRRDPRAEGQGEPE